MRGILIGIGVLIVAVVAVFFYAFSSIEGLIQQAVEKYGSEVTQAKVTLNKVDLDVQSGRGGLSGLTVGNPKGFNTPSAFKLGEFSIDIDTATVTQDPVVIRAVVITAPEVTYELSSGGSNIDAIQNNVNSYMAKLGDGKSAAKEDAGGGPKLIVENLIVKDGAVNVSATILEGKKMSAPLPDIHLKDIGKEKGGATPAEVAERLLTSLNDGARKAVSSIGIGKTLDSLKQHLAGATEGASKAVGDAVKGAGDAASGVTGSVTEGAGEVGKKLKGLLGN